jgi:hypothetical protein
MALLFLIEFGKRLYGMIFTTLDPKGRGKRIQNNKKLKKMWAL